MDIKEFSAPPPKYTASGKIAPPLQDPSMEWDTRDGSVRTQNRTLKIIIVGLLVTNIIQTSAFAVKALSSSIVPYVIEVDSTTGMAKNVGPAEAQAYTPKQAEVEYFLTDFIKNTRELPLDPIVYTQKWDKAYAFLTKNAAAKMSAEMQNDSPLQYLGKKTIQSNVTVIVPISENSFQIRWTEEEFLIGSGKKSVTPMTGIFTIQFSTPKDQNELKVNPLGIYISDFNWAKEAATPQK